VLFVQCHQVILLHAFSFFPVVNGVVQRVLYRGMPPPLHGREHALQQRHHHITIAFVELALLAEYINLWR
jgi:hypothetical protein